ncbi:TPA: hypothetical protein ACH3X3_012335 [Trebouxia sp. C0006]
MQAQGHLHSIPQSMGGPYASQSSLQPALHHHQGHQMGPDSDYGQPDTQHMLHNGQHPSHMTDQYHPQVSMYIQQPAQPMLSDVGEQKHDNVALPFPQPSMVTFAQPSMEQPQHPGHMEGASMGPQHPGHMEGASMGPQHQSGSGSDFPPNSPDGALSAGDNSKKPRGRPPGSKNRKTLLKEAGLLTDDPDNMEALENHPLLAAAPAKKRGRPPGSKNKKTLEAIQLKAEGTELQPVIPAVDPIPEEAVTVAAAASGILEAAPRPHEKVPGRRGRPPGSKNKRTLAMESLAQQGLTAGQQQAAMALLKQRAEQKRVEDEESLQTSIASGQKRRGRPPGSRNRPREDGDIDDPASKKQRGRPKGSKNRQSGDRQDLQLAVADSMQQQVQMGMADANPQMLLGSGALTDAVTAAMHAVPSGNVYWGDAAVQAAPGMSAQDMSADADSLQHQDALQHQGALQPHLAGPNGEGSHVMHSHHEGPYSVSYTETMQQPLSPMVVGPDMQQQNKEHHQMASHLNLHGDNGVHG